MSDRHPCSALIDGRCKNGFPVTVACAPWQDARGEFPEQTPMCMSEAHCAQIWPETGAPPMFPLRIDAAREGET